MHRDRRVHGRDTAMGRDTATCYLNTPQAAAILGLSPRTLET